MLLSIVVPVYNEEANLERCWRALTAVLERGAEAFEVLMVDDGSVDRSWDTLCSLAAEPSAAGRLRGLRLSRNFGKEAAILAGLRMARGDAVVVMDADLQHPPDLIPRMLKLWDGGRVAVVEAVKRRRQSESWPLRLGARLYYRLFILASGIDLRGSSDFKLLDRRVVEQYTSLPEAGRFFRGLTAWLGFTSAAVEFEPPRRQAGRSRWGLGALFQMARRTVISFSSLPLRLVTWLGAFGLVFSLVLTLQTLWYQWQGLAEEGFPTVILLILGMGSMILLGLGLIGEYVAEIYIEVKRRPSYIVSDSTGEPQIKPSNSN